MFGLELVTKGLYSLDFTELILIKRELVATWFMFGNFYIKNDYDKMKFVWEILIKITFEYTITKKAMSFKVYFKYYI